MESTTLGVKLWYLEVEISREIIGVAIGVRGIGNFGGGIMVSGGRISKEILGAATGVSGISNFGGGIMVSGSEKFKGNHMSRYRNT